MKITIDNGKCRGLIKNNTDLSETMMGMITDLDGRGGRMGKAAKDRKPRKARKATEPEYAKADLVEFLPTFKRPEDGYLYAQRQLLLTPPWTDGEPVMIVPESHTKENGDVETVERKYLIHTEHLDYSTTGLMPLHGDWLVFLCALKELQQNIREDHIPSKSKTSFYKILEMCRYADNGKNYAMVRESLAKKWSNIQVHTVEYDEKGKPRHDYHGIMSVMMDDRSIEITWDQKWLRKFGQALVSDVKLINFQHRTALKTSRSRRCLDFIDGKIEDREGVVELPAQTWRLALNIVPKFPSQILYRLNDTIGYINREIPGLGITAEAVEGGDDIIRVTVGSRKEKVPDTPPRSFLKMIDGLSCEEIKTSKKAVQMLYNRFLNDETQATLEANMVETLMSEAEAEDRSSRLAEGILGFLISGKEYDWLADVMAYSIERKYAKRKKPLEDFEAFYFKIARDGDLESWRAKRAQAQAKAKVQGTQEILFHEKTREDQMSSQRHAMILDIYADALDAYIEKVSIEDMALVEASIKYTPMEEKAMIALKKEGKDKVRQAKIRSALERRMLLEYDATLPSNRDEMILAAQPYMKPVDASFLNVDISTITAFHRKNITEELFLNWLKAAFMFYNCPVREKAA